MDILKVLSHIVTMEETLKKLRQEKQELAEAMGFDNPLQFALDCRSVGLQGNELEEMSDHVDALDSLTSVFLNMSLNYTSVWKEATYFGPNPEIWVFIEPIASYIEPLKLLEYYHRGNETLKLVQSENKMQKALENFVACLLIDLDGKGINLTLEEVIEKCDMEAYAKYVSNSNEEALEQDHTKMACYIMTYFVDAVLANDPSAYVHYDVNRVYELYLDLKDEEEAR